MKYILMILSLMAFVVYGHSQENKDEIKNVIIAFQNDFNEGSFKNAENYTTEDWEHINPGGGITRGRQDVLKEVRAVHQTFLRGVTYTIESINTRMIVPDVAIADVIHVITPYTTPDGVKHGNERHIKTYVVVRKNGKWLLSHDQNTIIQGQK